MDINASDFKAKCLRILDEVARTGEGVTIRKRGRVIARLVPATQTPAEDPFFALRGSVTILGDILEPIVDPATLTFDGENIAVRAKPRHARRAKR